VPEEAPWPFFCRGVELGKMCDMIRRHQEVNSDGSRRERGSDGVADERWTPFFLPLTVSDAARPWPIVSRSPNSFHVYKQAPHPPPPSLPPSLPQVFFRYYPERVQTLEYFGWKWWWPSMEEGEEPEAPQAYNRYNNFEGMDLVLKLKVGPSLPPSIPPSLPLPLLPLSVGASRQESVVPGDFLAPHHPPLPPLPSPSSFPPFQFVDPEILSDAEVPDFEALQKEVPEAIPWREQDHRVQAPPPSLFSFQPFDGRLLFYPPPCLPVPHLHVPVPSFPRAPFFPSPLLCFQHAPPCPSLVPCHFPLLRWAASPSSKMNRPLRIFSSSRAYAVINVGRRAWQGKGRQWAAQRLPA